VLSSEEAFRGVMLELGWHSPTIPAPIAALATPAGQLVAVLGDGSVDPSDLDDVLDAIQNLAEQIRGLEGQGASMPSELTAEGFDQLIAKQLVDYLVVGFLEDEYPATISLLAAVGIIRETELDDEGNRPGSIQHTIAWEEIPNLLGDPRQLFVNAYGWTRSDFDYALLLEMLMNLGEGLDLSIGFLDLTPDMREPVEGGPEDPDNPPPSALVLPLFEANDGEAGIQIRGLPQAGSRKPGVAILPYGYGAWPNPIQITDHLSLSLETSLDLAAGVAIVVRPGEPVEVLHGLDKGSPSTGGEVRAELVYTGNLNEKTLLLGSSDGTRLEAAGVNISTGGIAGPDGDLFLEAQLVGGQLVVAAADGGSFLAMLLGDADRTIAMAPAIGWSTTRGAYLRAGSRLSLVLPLRLALGPITIEDVLVDIVPDGEEIAIDVAAAIVTSVGPFTALVDKMGLSASFRFAGSGGNLGPLDAEIQFLAPTLLIFTIESEAVTGGGFLQIDPEEGRYAGGLALDILGIGVSAVVIIDTQVPRAGWALFASLGATFATPLPIGFGFTLIGVGGLLAVNRTMNIEGLASGLKTGAADAILFPDNILEDAAAILNGLEQWFPTQPATTVFGPVIQIGWGNPTLISAQLGVVIVLPDLIVALLGSVEMLLPTPEEAVIALRMDILGAVDIPASEVAIAASLHDSNLLGIFELSGDMAFFARLAGAPIFVLSVGGYHPQFKPPGSIPDWVLDLRRTRASVPLGAAVQVVLSNYVAVTSNTVQFGGRFQLTASVKVLLTTYTAEGWFSINLLLVLKPFKFVARATAGVSVSAGDRELFGVQLTARLEGPKPWYANGSASFTFFGFDVSFGFEIGSKAAGEPREAHNVGADVAAAMREAGSAAAVDSGGAWASGVVMTDQLPEGLWIRPDQDVEIRQSLAPLNRTITAYGEMVPSADRIVAENVTLGGAPVAAPNWVEDYFAPAQYDRLDETSSLAAPSYELMTDGVRFGDDEVAISVDTGTECAAVSREPEESIFERPKLSISKYVSPPRRAPGALSARTVLGPKMKLRPTLYTIVKTVDGTRAGSVLTDAGLGLELNYVDAQRVLQARAAADPLERSRLRVAPAYAAMR